VERRAGRRLGRRGRRGRSQAHMLLPLRPGHAHLAALVVRRLVVQARLVTQTNLGRLVARRLEEPAVGSLLARMGEHAELDTASDRVSLAAIVAVVAMGAGNRRAVVAQVPGRGPVVLGRKASRLVIHPVKVPGVLLGGGEGAGLGHLSLSEVFDV
jgi:hypothetical protein